MSDTDTAAESWHGDDTRPCTDCAQTGEVWVGPDRNDFGYCGTCHGYGFLNEFGMPYWPSKASAALDAEISPDQ